jgi:hypothetical protein
MSVDIVTILGSVPVNDAYCTVQGSVSVRKCNVPSVHLSSLMLALVMVPIVPPDLLTNVLDANVPSIVIGQML